MAKQNSGKIRQYRKPLNINLGMIIFSVIFIYIIICVVSYFNDEHVASYEVREGSLSQENVYKGLALREETIVTSEYSGYINYYAREGERVGSNDLVCTIDESGKLKDLLNEQAAEGTSLTDSDLSEIRTQITNFTSRFSANSFDQVYDFKFELQGTALKLANINVLENLNSINGTSSGQLVSLCNSPASGIIVYSTDGYESITPEQVTSDMFTSENYIKTQLINSELVSAGDPIYKLSTNENWSIVIPVEKERAQELLEEEYVKVRFLKNQYESWGQVTVLDNADGNTYVQLDFNNSMITFCTDRFIDIELITDDEQGLKVPNTAIAEKEFYTVPVDYVTKGGNSGETGVLKESYTEQGEASSEFVPVTIYHMDEENQEYYIDNPALVAGDRLLKPDSSDTYTISKSGTLTGVYNVDRGYADFKEIQILSQNAEYSIVEPNTTYGLSAYDHIVQNADSVDIDELILD